MLRARPVRGEGAVPVRACGAADVSSCGEIPVRTLQEGVGSISLSLHHENLVQLRLEVAGPAAAPELAQLPVLCPLVDRLHRDPEIPGRLPGRHEPVLRVKHLDKRGLDALEQRLQPPLTLHQQIYLLLYFLYLLCFHNSLHYISVSVRFCMCSCLSRSL